MTTPTQDSTLPKMNRGKYTLESMAQLAVNTVIQVSQMSQSKAIQFLSDSQDTESVRECIPLAMRNKHESYFVVLDESGCDYAQIWGMAGIVPLLEKSITKIL